MDPDRIIEYVPIMAIVKAAVAAARQSYALAGQLTAVQCGAMWDKESKREGEKGARVKFGAYRFELLGTLGERYTQKGQRRHAEASR